MSDFAKTLRVGLGIMVGLVSSSGATLALTQAAIVPASPTEATETPTLDWWAVDDSTKVLPAMDLGAPRADEDGPVRIAGAGGETVAFQLVMSSARSITRVSVGVGALVPQVREGDDAHVIPLESFGIFLETYIDCPPSRDAVVFAPGRCPDPLVPLWADGPGSREIAHPLRVPVDQKRVIWIDIAIPRGQPAGRYHGRLQLDLDGEATLDIPIELEVYAFDLPSRPSLDAWVPLYSVPMLERERILSLDTRESLDLSRRYFRMAHAHRFITQAIDYEPILTWDVGTGALLDADWTMYDLFHASVLDGSIFADGAPPAFWKVGPLTWWGALPGVAPFFGGSAVDGTLNEAHRRALTEYAREVRRHFDERGFRGSELFMYMIDNPDVAGYPVLDQATAEYGRAIHEAGAGILHMVTMPPREGSHTLGAVDIWAPKASAYDPGVMKERQKLGERAWLHEDDEPFIGGRALSDEGLGLRSFGWIARRYGADGIFLSGGNLWNDDPYRDGVRGTGNDLEDSVLFYPGAMLSSIGFPAIRAPVSSVRMKLLRRGLFDHDYFALLESLGGDPDPVVERIVPRALGEAGDAKADSVRPVQRGAWSHDPAEWDRARNSIAREIERRTAK